MKILEGKTVKLRDNENNVILPRTLARNVHMPDGKTMEDVIAEVREEINLGVSDNLRETLEALIDRVAYLEERIENCLEINPKPEQPEDPVDPEPEEPEIPEEPEVEVKVEEVVVEGVEEFEFSPEVFEYELQPQEGVEVVSLYVQLPEEVEVKQITVNDEAVEPVLPLEVQLGEEDTVVKVTVDQMEKESAPASETEKVYTFVFKAIVVPEQPEEPDTPVEPEPVVSHVEDLVIAQYYGAGGKTDGMLTCDFIELYNKGEHDVLMQYASLNYTKMGKNADSQNQWQLIQLPEVVLPPHHSFLIQGQMNREAVEGEAIPMVVAECDMQTDMEFDNGAIKLVLSQAKEAYPAGQVDPFEIDETIIDHVYACADDKADRMDVEPMFMDLSKNNGVIHSADGIWVVADYKDENDMPQNAELLPKNMAAGEHDMFLYVAPEEPETPVEPEQPALAPIMYGYFPLEVGTEFNITSYDKITLEAVRKGVIREAQERVEGKINIAGEGLLPEGAYIVFAIRADLEITPVRDNGFGGHVPFYEEVCGANGVVVDFEGVQYKLFGEMALVEGEWFAYMD